MQTSKKAATAERVAKDLKRFDRFWERYYDKPEFERLTKVEGNWAWSFNKNEVVRNASDACRLFKQHFRPDWVDYVPSTLALYVNGRNMLLSISIEQSFEFDLNGNARKLILSKAIALGASSVIIGKVNIWGDRLSKENEDEEAAENGPITCKMLAGSTELDDSLDKRGINLLDVIAFNSSSCHSLKVGNDIPYFSCS
jgi:hypothetical protein